MLFRSMPLHINIPHCASSAPPPTKAREGRTSTQRRPDPDADEDEPDFPVVEPPQLAPDDREDGEERVEESIDYRQIDRDQHEDGLDGEHQERSSEGAGDDALQPVRA